MQEIEKKPLFDLGHLVATPGALAALEKAGQNAMEFLSRHVTGDWGEIPEVDKKENQFSLEKGFRLMSSYRTTAGDRVWVITEWTRHTRPFCFPMNIDSRDKEKKEITKMNTAIAVTANNAIAPVTSSVQDISLDRIQESKTNPRRTFDETKLAELAGDIRQHGVLQPALVRPLPGGEDGFFELVAGARRYRASQIAKRETIPASIRELTDTECLELQLIENLQRTDVHELDEARGYASSCNCNPRPTPSKHLQRKSGARRNMSMRDCV
jgi:hypothetical protein